MTSATRHLNQKSSCRIEDSNYHFPPLFDSSPIPVSDLVKFIGLRFHANHSGLPHLKESKRKCLCTLYIIKYLAHPVTGYNIVLISMYYSLVRSILDYNFLLYALARPHSLPISNLSKMQPFAFAP